MQDIIHVMIRRVAAIFFILLANIILLAHSMIIHHHHDSYVDEISGQKDYERIHAHHPGDYHQHNNPVKEEPKYPLESQHKHEFPQHYHTSATGDLYFTQLTLLKYSKQIQQTVTIILLRTDCFELYKVPENKYVICDLPFLIFSPFKPGAIALRGPPTIG